MEKFNIVLKYSSIFSNIVIVVVASCYFFFYKQKAIGSIWVSIGLFFFLALICGRMLSVHPEMQSLLETSLVIYCFALLGWSFLAVIREIYEKIKNKLKSEYEECENEKKPQQKGTDIIEKLYLKKAK